MLALVAQPDGVGSHVGIPGRNILPAKRIEDLPFRYDEIEAQHRAVLLDEFGIPISTGGEIEPWIRPQAHRFRHQEEVLDQQVGLDAGCASTRWRPRDLDVLVEEAALDPFLGASRL
jgi:hypothetical protein